MEDEPGTLTLKLKKKDSQTGSTPQGNASLAGAVYQVSYQLGGQTVTEELTSDAQGNLGTLEGIPFGTVTVKELTAPEGYRLDTEVHTYTVDGSQLTGDVYELEVDDLTEDVHAGRASPFRSWTPRLGQLPRAMPAWRVSLLKLSTRHSKSLLW